MFDSIEAWEGMRKAGKAAADSLRALDVFKLNWEGMSLLEIDGVVASYIRSNGWIPACVGYNGYKHATCISVNDVVCHGVPTDYRLKRGDIFNVDVTVIVDGWFGDHSKMFYVPPISIPSKRLIRASYRAMMDGIGVVAPGKTIGAIERAIETSILDSGFSGVLAYGGHGIGRQFHLPPFIGAAPGHYKDVVLEEGMFFTVEPMVNLGGFEVTKPGDDGWTVKTRDGSLSAQWEHTIGVTKDGYEIFTQ